jgi:hypothetical protein
VTRSRYVEKGGIKHEFYYFQDVEVGCLLSEHWEQPVAGQEHLLLDGAQSTGGHEAEEEEEEEQEEEEEEA